MSEADRKLVVALDGPAGAGKSSVALALASRLGLTYVETGAIYRAVALEAMRRGVALDDGAGLGKLAQGLEIRFSLEADINRVWVGGEEVTEELRQNDVSMGASKVSAFPEVRAALLELQRRLGLQGSGSVLEGRDIGTVVFPDATHKYFVTASVEARALRRHRQLAAHGRQIDLSQLMEDIARRDEADSNRAVAPMKPAADAVVVDTTGLTLAEVVEHLAGLIEGRNE